MRSARSWVALGSAGLAISAMSVAMGIPSATAASSPHRSDLRGSMSPASERSKPAGKVATSARVSFDLTLKVRHAARAASLVRKVSSPSSARYHHYLTDKQWESRFSPTVASVHAAEACAAGRKCPERAAVPLSAPARLSSGR